MIKDFLLGNNPGEDQVDNEMEAPYDRITRMREGVAALEYNRHTRLLEKGVIGRVSNKIRDLAGELAVIPKRVPFKWQRGNKIGKISFLNTFKKNFCQFHLRSSVNRH